MYNVSANFHNLAIADSPKTRIRVYFISDAVNCWDDADVQNNGTLLVGAVGDTDSNGRIGQGGVTVTEIFNKDKNITLGGTVSYQIGMTLVNSDGALNNFAFGRCKVYLDVYDDANSVWLPCPLGVFRIELPVKRKVQLITATGYDQMQALNAIADTWWNGLNFTGGLTIANILNSMVTQLGLHLSATSSTNMVNTTLSFTTPPIDSVERTYRDILGWIAEATGTVAHFNRDGELDMRPYLTPQIGGNNIVIDTDTTGNQCLSVDIAEYSVSQIDALTIKLTTADQGVTVGSGTNVYTIMDNPFLYGPDVATIQNKLTPIYNRLHTYVAFAPISTRLIYDWSIEAGDYIRVLNDSVTYLLPIFQQKLVWRGGYVTAELISSGDPVRPQVSSGERETYRYNKEMATKVGDNEIISKINQTAEQIQIQASKVNLTGYITATNLATVGQTVINGGNITTGEISADRIQGGTLIVGGQNNENGTIIVKDAGGNTTGTIDNTGANIYGSLSSSQTVGGVSFSTQISGANIKINNGALPMFTVVPKGDGTSDGRVSMRGSNATLYLTGSDLVYSARKNGNPFAAVSMGVSGTDPNSYGGLSIAGPSADGSRIQSIDLNPSGVSRFGSSLGGGDVEINGVLDVTRRRAYATLSSEGWYRVFTIAGQGRAANSWIANLAITRSNDGAGGETHSIKLLGSADSFSFVQEISKSSVVGIDKIRYTRTTAYHDGFVDIHYNLSVPTVVSVMFDFYIVQNKQKDITVNGLINVSPAPDGEIIYATYTFAANAYHKPVAREGVSNGWSYVLYADYTIDATRTITDTLSNYTTVNGFYGYYIPSIVTPFYMEDTNYYIGTEWSIGTGFSIHAGILSKATNQFNAYALATASGSQSVKLTMHLKGTVLH